MGRLGRALLLPAASALAALSLAAPPPDEADGADVSAGPPIPVPALEVPPEPPDVPIVRESRYELSAAIRPLYVFWIRAHDVGDGRILWREDGEGRRGYELLIGSDPRRAPRKINRWGWEREDLSPEGAALFGLMRKTDEDSLDEAKDELRREGEGGFVYKSIRSAVADDRVRAENTLVRASRDFTYYDLAELQALVRAADGPPRVREGTVPPGTRPGFLFAASATIDRAVDAALETPRRLLSGTQETFTFNAALYDLRLRSTKWVEQKTYGGQSYEGLVRLECEHFNREKRSRERFVLVCPTQGPLARVPVYIEYQPKWWFKVEGVLGGSETSP